MDESLPLDFLLSFSSTLQASVEPLLCGYQCAPDWETKRQQGGLGGTRTVTHLWLSASPLLIDCVALELLPKASEPVFPTCKMRLIINMLFTIEKWLHLRYSVNDSHLFFFRSSPLSSSFLLSPTLPFFPCLQGIYHQVVGSGRDLD